MRPELVEGPIPATLVEGFSAHLPIGVVRTLNLILIVLTVADL